MTLGGAGVLVVVAGLTGALSSCGDPRAGGGEAVPADSISADSISADSLPTVPADSADSNHPARVPAESAVRRPPIMDPAARDRPPARLPRPDTAGGGA